MTPCTIPTTDLTTIVSTVARDNIAPQHAAKRTGSTLGERFKHTQAVGVLKAEHDLPPSDPTREAAQIKRLEDLATRADLDPEFAKKFLNFIIAEVIQHHKTHQS